LSVMGIRREAEQLLIAPISEQWLPVFIVG
jgi:hypothetical protein